MADYYSVLLKAIERLENKSENAREDIYGRARKALVRRLEDKQLNLSVDEIKQHQTALEDAISQIEQENFPKSPLDSGEESKSPPKRSPSEPGIKQSSMPREREQVRQSGQRPSTKSSQVAKSPLGAAPRATKPAQTKTTQVTSKAAGEVLHASRPAVGTNAKPSPSTRTIPTRMASTEETAKSSKPVFGGLSDKKQIGKVLKSQEKTPLKSDNRSYLARLFERFGKFAPDKAAGKGIGTESKRSTQKRQVSQAAKTSGLTEVKSVRQQSGAPNTSDYAGGHAGGAKSYPLDDEAGWRTHQKPQDGVGASGVGKGGVDGGERSAVQPSGKPNKVYGGEVPKGKSIVSPSIIALAVASIVAVGLVGWLLYRFDWNSYFPTSTQPAVDSESKASGEVGDQSDVSSGEVGEDAASIGEASAGKDQQSNGQQTKEPQAIETSDNTSPSEADDIAVVKGDDDPVGQLLKDDDKLVASNFDPYPNGLLEEGQKVVLLEENKLHPDNANSYVGRAIWTTAADVNNREKSVIVANIDVPERGLKIEMTIALNSDTSLDASHLVTMKFEASKAFVPEKIARLFGISMRKTEDSELQTLLGAVAKVSDSIYWMALSAANSETVEHNTGLLENSNWFEIPLFYSDGQRALLAFDKGRGGNEVFKQVFNTWKDSMVKKP